MTITNLLASYLYDLKYEDLPTEVVEKAKACILDTLGCGLGAYNHDDILKMIKALGPQDSKGDYSLWGHNLETSLWTATLINASMCHAYDFDDAHKEGKVHAGVVIVPTALTLAQLYPITGKELVTAVVGAYEVMLRIAIGMNSTSHRLRGWHNTATCGTFGAAAVAGKLLGLTQEELVCAFGTAGTQSSGIWAFATDGTASKKFHAGRAAQSGIMSAFLAKEGYTGSSNIIEAQDGGLFKAVSHDYNFNRVTEALGRDFEIMNVSFKPYPCCRTIHPAIDAALEISTHRINCHDIKEINVYTYKVAKIQNDLPLPPANSMLSQFNLPYLVAIALHESAVGMEHLEAQYFQNKLILNTASKVKVFIDENIEKEYPRKWKCRVELLLNDGKIIVGITDAAKGDADNPLTYNEHSFKINTLLNSTPFNSKEIINFISSLETNEELSSFTSLLK